MYLLAITSNVTSLLGWSEVTLENELRGYAQNTNRGLILVLLVTPKFRGDSRDGGEDTSWTNILGMGFKEIKFISLA